MRSSLGNTGWLFLMPQVCSIFRKGTAPHCLKKVINKGTKEEKAVYYHHVLEAKLVLGDGVVVSMGTEFIENEDENVSKNDCETKAFKRLSKKLKKRNIPACRYVS